MEVNNGLVDDGLVEKEKIGGSNYFWSFPAKKDRMVQMQHQQNLELLESLQSQVTQAREELHKAQEGRQGDDRAEKLGRLAQIRTQKAQLEQELAVLKENDPQALADLEQELQFVTQGAHRWTDNIFQCQSYLVKKRGMDKKQVQKILGIGSAFDCTYHCIYCWCCCCCCCTRSYVKLTLLLIFADPEDKMPK